MAEVAECLDITVPTAKTRAHRARLLLRQRLGDFVSGAPSGVEMALEGDLRANLQAAALTLPSGTLAKLEALGTKSEQKPKEDIRRASLCYRSDGIHRFRNCTG